MTSGQKIAFSLLVAMGLFAVFVLSLNSKLFNELETRFYTQSKIEQNTGQLDRVSEGCDSYITKILNLTEKGENAWVKNASVRSFYVQNASESDVMKRRRLTEQLFAEIPALSGIRIVDKNGRNLHYSSFDDTDLLKQSGITKIYKNYNDITKDADEIPFEQLSKLVSETKSVLLFDQSRNRIVLSVPFCWVDGIYSGVSLFYLSINEIEKELNASDIIPIGQNAFIISDSDFSGGLVLNIPYGEKKSFEEPVKQYWKKHVSAQQPEKLLEMPDGRFYLALSSNRNGKIQVSAVYPSNLFELSKEIRILIYICIFISILLIVFLIFSFFRDPVVTLQKRIKKIQLGLIENYIDGKEKREWSDIARQLRGRKNDLSTEIIRSLHVHSKKRRDELSEYLDKNWDEIFSIFETKAGTSSAASGAVGAAGTAELTGTSIAEIRRMLEEVLQSRSFAVPVAAASTPVSVAPVEDVDELDEVEELAEDAEELEEPEEIEEVEELAEDVEDLDEVEELAEDVKDLDEVEELTEDVDEAEEVEELAEEVEDLDEVEELTEDVEGLDEVEELTEDVEDLDEVEELTEEVEESDDVEEITGEAEEVEEDADELEVFEEYVEPAPFNAFMANLAQTKKEYKPSNDTYFASDKFATVENLYAEELKLGNFDDVINKTKTSPLEIKFFPIPAYSKDEIIEETETLEISEKSENTDKSEFVEELTEEVPSYLDEPDFSMIGFGDNYAQDIPELEAANAIVEEDGVYSIAENLEYTNVVQDPEFKELVDSILG
ncbi:MAG: hypothetical protein SPK18_08135 [Treponema sp.]|nr:hypothetical protein [Treponema sp.]MDY5758533.1 hypothetical protein [Treponema sp.]